MSLRVSSKRTSSPPLKTSAEIEGSSSRSSSSQEGEILGHFILALSSSSSYSEGVSRTPSSVSLEEGGENIVDLASTTILHGVSSLQRFEERTEIDSFLCELETPHGDEEDWQKPPNAISQTLEERACLKTFSRLPLPSRFLVFNDWARRGVLSLGGTLVAGTAPSFYAAAMAKVGMVLGMSLCLLPVLGGACLMVGIPASLFLSKFDKTDLLPR